MADFSIFSPDGGTTALNVKDAKARDIVSDAFDSETSYDIGDYCIYEGALYKCTTAHTGAWNAADFSATTIAEELKNSGGGGGATDTVKYTSQSLTSEQQAQARENIGAAASTDVPTDAVKYTVQSLTGPQKTQAQTNIGIVCLSQSSYNALGTKDSNTIYLTYEN